MLILSAYCYDLTLEPNEDFERIKCIPGSWLEQSNKPSYIGEKV